MTATRNPLDIFARKQLVGEDARCDMRGRIAFLAEAKGYVMVRRPYCAPFVMSLKDWLKLPVKR